MGDGVTLAGQAGKAGAGDGIQHLAHRRAADGMDMDRHAGLLGSHDARIEMGIRHHRQSAKAGLVSIGVEQEGGVALRHAIGKQLHCRRSQHRAAIARLQADQAGDGIIGLAAIGGARKDPQGQLPGRLHGAKQAIGRCFVGRAHAGIEIAGESGFQRLRQPAPVGGCIGRGGGLEQFARHLGIGALARRSGGIAGGVALPEAAARHRIGRCGGDAAGPQRRR